MRTSGSTERLADTLRSRDVSRRDFLRFCGAIAASVGLSATEAPRIARALEQAAQTKPAVWLSLGACTGCTDSMAQSTYPDLAQTVLELLSVDYWSTLAAGAGATVRASLAKTVADQKGKFVLLVEGAVMAGFNGNALRVAGVPATEDLKTLGEAAAVVLAVGSCATDGGWVRARPDQAGGTGVASVVDPSKVVNLPTCPVNPEWVVAMIVDYLLLGRTVPVDGTTRLPPLLYGQTIHDDCGRRGHFENSEFVTEFGSPEAAKGYCLYQMGCKGPVTRTRCPVTRWNGKASWCVEAGSPCIGCGNPNWVDAGTPFVGRRSGFQGVTPETVGVVLGGAALAGIVIHGIAQTATGRMGHGGPPEGPEPELPIPLPPDEEEAEAPGPGEDHPPDEAEPPDGAEASAATTTDDEAGIPVAPPLPPARTPRRHRRGGGQR